MERTAKKNFIIDVFYTAVIISLIILGSFVLIKYLFPFVIGTIIAFAVQRPSQFLSGKLKIKKGYLSAFLSVAIYLFLGFLVVFLLYRLVKFSAGFADLLPSFLEKAGEILSKIQSKYSNIFSLLPSKFADTADSLIDNMLGDISAKIGRLISNFAGVFAKRMPSFFISSIVTLVATCYIAKDFEQLLKFLKNLLGESITQKTIKIKNIFVGSVLKLLKGYAILSLIAFCELYLGFLVIGIEYPFVLAAIIAFVDILPVIGTGTILVPWAVICALIGNISLSLSLAVLYIITVLVRNFLEPKIIGSQIGISSLFTLIFMFAGLKILGVLGLILFPIIFIVTIKYFKEEMAEGLSV